MSASYFPMDHSGPTPAAGAGQRVLGARPRVARAFYAARARSSLLHAGVVAAVLVVADKAMDSWTEGNLLIGWMVLWVLAFAGLALLAAPSRRAAASLRAAFKSQNERRMRAAQDDQYWQLALSDPRIMADIRRAAGDSPLPATRTYPDYRYWLYCPPL
ncbi:hypothetical protein [Caenimonas soli]|uniref:hypothetical protein n=1 Tax=Caenimonas soli TaxID=2735555 RepID=UPI001A9B6908|nr:hypothetical protein [Caenimonas soli]